MRYLKQSTSVDLPIGPFLNDTDGKTAETALTLTQPAIRLKKNAAAWAQKAAAQTLTHEENGYYEVTLDATDTDTLGALRLAVAGSGALPVFEDFMVVPANVWDSLFGSDRLQVGLREIESTVTLPAAAVVGLGLIAAGTLSGTHSTTTADLGANAPSYDISGATLLIAGRPPRVVDSYNTSTGVATFSPAMASAPVDALEWALLSSAPASTAVLPGVDVTNWKGATAPAMTGDAFARLGAPAGASVSVDVAAVKTDTAGALTRLPAALVGGRMDASVGAVVDGVLTAAKFAAGAFDAVWSVAARLLTAGTNIVLAKGAGVTGFNDPTSAAIAAAVRADQTTELGRIDTTISSRLSSAGYTAPPSAAANAAAVRADQTTELGRIDAAVSSRAAPGAAMALTSGERSSIVAALFAAVTEGTETFIQTFRIMRAGLAGKSSGHAAGTPAYRDAADTKNRITAVTSVDGDRTSVTTDGA